MSQMRALTDGMAKLKQKENGQTRRAQGKIEATPETLHRVPGVVMKKKIK